MITMLLTISETRGVQWCNRFCSKLTFSRGHILSEHIMLSCAFFRQENRLTMNIQKFKLEHIKDWIERSKLNTWGSLLSKRRGQIFDDRGEINKHVGPPSGSIYFVTMRPRCIWHCDLLWLRFMIRGNQETEWCQRCWLKLTFVMKTCCSLLLFYFARAGVIFECANFLCDF